MDRISPLSDDLILKILSELPSKSVVTTSLLSKRWCDLWKHVPKLKYCVPEQETSSSFVPNFLLLHKAPVLETLDLDLRQKYHPTDIEIWIRIAIARGVRTLQLYSCILSLRNIRLPGSLYTCETLVTLHLCNASIVDVPSTICFPSLKILILMRVDFPSDEIFQRILSGCPVLEYLDLIVIIGRNVNMKIFTIMVPSLQILLIHDLKYGNQTPGDDVGFVIKAPSLKSLTVVARFSWVCSLVNMPNLVEANINLPHGDSTKKLLGFLSQTPFLMCNTTSVFISYRRLLSSARVSRTMYVLCRLVLYIPLNSEYSDSNFKQVLI